MSDEASDLARLLVVVADDLDHRGYHAAGAVRQGAGLIIELLASQPPAPVTAGRCAGCGAELPRGGPGRPRRWCAGPECQRRRKAGAADGRTPTRRRKTPAKSTLAS